MNDDTAVLNVAAGAEDDVNRDDELAQELAKAAPKKWWNKATIVLAAVVLLVGGFVGGLQAQKQWGTSSTAGATGNRFPGAGTGSGRYGGGAGAYGFPGGGNFPGGGTGTGAGQGAPAAGATTAAAGTTGTVKLVDGDTIYVQTADGNV